MYFDANLLTHQIVWSALVVWVMRVLKASKSPWLAWISAHSFLVNRTIAIVASGAVALGLHWKYGYDSAVNNGTLTITLTGASFWGLVDHGRDWLFSYIVQQSGYRITEPSVLVSAPSAPGAP